MTLLVLSGTGPTLQLDSYFRGSLFDESAVEHLQHSYFGYTNRRIALDQLVVRERTGSQNPLLRRHAPHGIPHLTSATLDSILRDHGIEAEVFDLSHLWAGDREPVTDDPEAVLLSTSFIVNRRQLAAALQWILDRYEGIPIVLGGQYSNIKYPEILRHYPQVTAVVRGDGELALEPIKRALQGSLPWCDVPNVALIHDDRLQIGPLQYAEMSTMRSPRFVGPYATVPYESMRGCPYSCKFCSFPAASPKFRWKPAAMIADDWQRYAEDNGARAIRALDSIFTIPPRRLRDLMALLAGTPGPSWEGFSRASSIRDSGYVEMLTEGRCSQLSIGFESMSDAVLGYMGKRVSAAANRRANELLRSSAVGSRGHFMVGYPGETPADFVATSNYLRREYAGEFKLSIFSFTDETMPVWRDADRFDIRVDPDSPEYGWSHVGMSVQQAQALHKDAIVRTRWDSDDAVWLFWQRDYETPLVPDNDRWSDLFVQKLVERLAFLPLDFPDPRAGKHQLDTLLWQLRIQGVSLCDVSQKEPNLASA